MSDPITLSSLADNVEIAPGVLMPRLGLGTYKADDGPDVAREVQVGLSLGYRLIDTAALYGNEVTIGETVRASGISREDIFVASKVWNSDQGYRPTLAAFDKSMSNLAFDYLDLYLVHWPWLEHMRDTWRAMEEILSSGRTRAIGVCNHLPEHLDALSEFATVMPAVNQFEFHPRLQQPDLQAACREYGITMQAWAPLMRGKVNDVPLLVAIAETYDKTPAQIAIRWILQKGITTIPKSVHDARIAENCAVYDFALSDDEMLAIDWLDAAYRIGKNPHDFASMGAAPQSRR